MAIGGGDSCCRQLYLTEDDFFLVLIWVFYIYFVYILGLSILFRMTSPVLARYAGITTSEDKTNLLENAEAHVCATKTISWYKYNNNSTFLEIQVATLCKEVWQT